MRLHLVTLALAVVGLVCFNCSQATTQENPTIFVKPPIPKSIRPVVQQGHAAQGMQHGRENSNGNKTISAQLKAGFVNNGKYIVSYDALSNGVIKLWDVQTGKLLNNYFCDHVVRALDVASDGIYMVASDNRGNFSVWDVNSAERHLRYYDRHMGNGQFDLTGRYIYSTNGYSESVVRDVSTGKSVGHFGARLRTIFRDKNGKYRVIDDYWVKDLLSKKVLFKIDKGAYAVAVDPTGEYIVSGGADKQISLWSVNQKNRVDTFIGYDDIIRNIFFDLSGKYIAVISSNNPEKVNWETKVREFPSGKLIYEKSTLREPTLDPSHLFINTDQHVTEFKSGKKVFAFKLLKDADHCGVDPSGERLLAVSTKRGEISLWGIVEKQKIMDLRGINNKINHLAISPKGESLIVSDNSPVVTVCSLKDGHNSRNYKAHSNEVSVSTIGQKNKILAAVGKKYLDLWDVDTGKIKKIIEGNFKGVSAIDLNPRIVVLGFRDGTIKIYDIASGKQVNKLETSKAITDLKFDSSGTAVFFTSEKSAYLLKLKDGNIRQLFSAPAAIQSLNVTTNKEALLYSYDEKDRVYVSRWMKETNSITPLFSTNNQILLKSFIDPQARFFIGLTLENTIGIWSIENNKKVVTMYDFMGNVLCITPEGYFNNQSLGRKHVHFVDDNLKVYSFEQFVRRFYRPELVTMSMNGEDVKGVSMIDAASNPAPRIEFLSSSKKTKLTKDTAKAKLRVSDMGGGIGDILVYANETLISSKADAASTGPQTSIIEINIPLLPGENKIKAIAYNSENILASPPATLTLTAQYNQQKPSLHVLGIGIDSYENDNLNLNFCRKDVELLVKTIKNHAAPLFKEIRATTLVDPGNTSKKDIFSAFEKISKNVESGDYFLFYNSSHGDVTIDHDFNSQYYIITQNVLHLDPLNLKKDAISQNDLLGLIGKIPAQNKIIILDTCHSGAAGKSLMELTTASKVKSPAGRSDSETSMELLKITSGASVFTASQKAEAAIEGYNNHGLFTYTLVEGLKGRADKNRDGLITLSELKRHTELIVLERSRQHFKSTQVPFINIGTIDLPISKASSS